MPKEKVSRRAVIASATLVPLSTVRTAAAPKTVFTPLQRGVLEAFIGRLVPRDELGPGAVECGAASYIDLALADFLAAEKEQFLEGLNAVDAYARKTQDGAFADLAPDKQDAVLTEVERTSRAFFDRVRRLTLEGMMSDPHYGGNTNFGGWDLIRYPGPRLAVSADDQKLNSASKPLRGSAYGHGH